MLDRGVMQRFLEKTLVANSGCWEWTSTLHRDGYGKFWFMGRQAKAHRVSYELFVGDSVGAWVLHKCDNRKCVNPGHLYLGDAKRNAADRSARLRYRVMVPFETVQKIRALYASGGFTQQGIADIFKVKQTQVSRYVLGRQRLTS